MFLEIVVDASGASNLRQETDATDVVQAFFGVFGGLARGWAIEVGLVASTYPAGSASLGLTIRGGGTLRQEAE